MTDWRKSLLENIESGKEKKASDTLKAKRTYKDELYKSSPEYRAIEERDRKTKEIKSKKDLAEAKQKRSPQEDILRFGKKLEDYRKLAYKERILTEEDEDGNKVSRVDYLAKPNNEIFKKQEEAYSDSLSMANLAQKFGTRTPEIRKIKNEFEGLIDKYRKETPEFTGTGDGRSSTKIALKRAIADLSKKYGKSIPLLIDELYAK
ncbi:MAG TPA: hypothetical protein DF712_13650 [Balneola sp.]|nr:hypothetical protein [Balneola sp.]|tara:strand:+ start:953 stop:1567 length:615 start_codon:yes stop_codon:yes gene_type:complete